MTRGDINAVKHDLMLAPGRQVDDTTEQEENNLSGCTDSDGEEEGKEEELWMGRVSENMGKMDYIKEFRVANLRGINDE